MVSQSEKSYQHLHIFWIFARNMRKLVLWAQTGMLIYAKSEQWIKDSESLTGNFDWHLTKRSQFGRNNVLCMNGLWTSKNNQTCFIYQNCLLIRKLKFLNWMCLSFRHPLAYHILQSESITILGNNYDYCHYYIKIHVHLFYNTYIELHLSNNKKCH